MVSFCARPPTPTLDGEPTRIFAKAGERIVCDDGHHLCDVAVDLKGGDQIDCHQFTNWQQGLVCMPGVAPECAICGAQAFSIIAEKTSIRFADGWRS